MRMQAWELLAVSFCWAGKPQGTGKEKEAFKENPCPKDCSPQLATDLGFHLKTMGAIGEFLKDEAPGQAA